MPGEAEPDAVLLNGGGIPNNEVLPAGDITTLDTFDMLPFANLVRIVPEIPRGQFLQILENAVSRVMLSDVVAIDDRDLEQPAPTA